MMSGNVPPYRIERTGNRHSRAMIRDDVILIRLAGRLSESEERRHVESLLRRMSRAWQRQKLVTTVDPMRPLLEGADRLTLTPVIGPSIDLHLIRGTRTKTKKIPGGWTVTVGPSVRRRELHRLLWTCVSKTLKQSVEYFIDDVNDSTLQVSWKDLRLGYASSQWGSCGADGRIMLNAVLLFTTVDFLRYVIVHELAHRTVRNHSKAFWAEVARGCPDHKEIRASMKRHRICKL